MDPVKKPKCVLSGTDGNVFSIIGHVAKSLRRAGLHDEARDFTAAAFESRSYDEVIQLAMTHCEVE